MKVRWWAGMFLSGGVALLTPLAVARAFCCRLSVFQSRLIFAWLPPAGLVLIGAAFGIWWGAYRLQT